MAPRRAPFANWLRGGEAPQPGDELVKATATGTAPNVGSSGGGAKWSDDGGVGGEMIWNESIAGALGYGKKGAGAAYQWWIPLAAGLTCLGSFIAWAVLITRGRDATTRAMETMGVDFTWWMDAKGLIIATAVMYPIFVVAALAVSLWRMHLARTLDIHRPDVVWLKRSRAFQWLNVITSTLLWLMVVLLIVSVAGHAVWGYMAQMADLVGTRAIALVGPVWSAVGRVADSSRALTERVTGMLTSLPAVSGRKLLEEGAAAGAAAAAPTVGALLAAAAGGAVGGELAAPHGRALQQTGLLNGLGQLAAGLANGITAAANAIPASVPGMPANITIPGLPQLLPNGSANPLVGAITDVTRAIETQVVNPTGCPVYCIDLRNERWWVEPQAGCLCNLDRVAAALPHLNAAWKNVIPAVVALVFMYIGASWLLLHGASQWARTRAEAKLMERIPGAAAAAAAAADAAAKAASPRAPVVAAEPAVV